ncbi:Transcriptional activator protein LasR [compost metagenome]
MSSQHAHRSSVPQPTTTHHLPQVILTTKETEVLFWSALGKSSWEIGRIIGTTESGVNFHFTNIRSKYGVHSRQVALTTAMIQGLISLNALEHALENMQASAHDE